MNKKLIGLAVVATLSLSAFSASAEDMYRGAWYVVPGITYMNTDSGLDASNGAGGFIGIGKELSQSWDLQGRLGYNRADEDSNVAGASGKYKQTTLELDALYMFSRDQFRPFLLAGVGVARNNADYKLSVPGVDITGKKTSWLTSVGVGAQYLVSDRFGIQADLRHQWSRAEINSSGLVTSKQSGTVGNTLLNIGGIFRFGEAPPMVAAAAPEPMPIIIVEEAVPAPECVVQLETITIGAEELFGHNKSNIGDAGKAILDEAAALIKADAAITLVGVTGYTDRTGSFKYNQKLSERRSTMVGDYLVSQGVDGALISTTGRGESVPVVDCKGNRVTKALISCLAPNRRVEIKAQSRQELLGCQ